jgi:hypothetical protein
MIQILGFSPDVEPTTAGILADCSNLVSYDNGMRGAPTGQTPSGVPALAAACLGAGVVTKLDDSRRVIAGTASKLYELSSGSWSDISRGGNYNGGAETRWSFAQFGNSTIAANLADTTQSSTSGAFADIAGAPKAKIVFTVGTQVMALFYNDGSEVSDGWYCCATYDAADWTTSTTTLCAKGRLVSAPGRLTAGLRLGEYAIAYKEKAIFRGQFVGAPAVWDWQQIQAGEIGCVGQDAVCDLGGVHFFVGQDDFWLFDGGTPSPVGQSVKRWFASNSAQSLLYKTQCVFDRQNNLVWVFYVSNNSTSLDSALVWNTKTKQWGKVTISIEAALNYISSGITIDGLDSVSATIDGLSVYSFDSPFWNTGTRVMSVVNTSHQIQTLSGSTGNCSFTTWDAGDDNGYSMLSRIRVRFEQTPTTATVETFTKPSVGESYSLRSTGTLNGSKFDVLQSGRFHRAVITMSGNVKVTGIDAKVMPEGDE